MTNGRSILRWSGREKQKLMTAPARVNKTGHSRTKGRPERTYIPMVKDTIASNLAEERIQHKAKRKRDHDADPSSKIRIKRLCGSSGI